MVERDHRRLCLIQDGLGHLPLTQALDEVPKSCSVQGASWRMKVCQARRLRKRRQGSRLLRAVLQAGHQPNRQVLLEERDPLTPKSGIDLFLVRQLLLLHVCEGHVHDEVQDSLHLLSQFLAALGMATALNCTVPEQLKLLLLSHGLNHLVSQILVATKGLLLVCFLLCGVLLLARLSIPHNDLFEGLGPPAPIADRTLLDGLSA
mmetsp:Transcript_1040/g.2408  ORF Transcript_1040/g.2408 Transcript_1040/m.2408 type:complete len:205 (+) Transcript_1040:1006-1620(+)